LPDCFLAWKSKLAIWGKFTKISETVTRFNMELRPSPADKTKVSGGMETGQSPSTSRKSFYRDIAIVLVISLAARIIFILAMPDRVRSTDSYNWEKVAGILANGANPYQSTDLVNWPPSWLQLLFFISKISSFLSVPFFRVLQVFLIFVESTAIVLLMKLIRQVIPGAPVRMLTILGIALNPAAILLICQHGNFDVVVALWLLLFMRSLLRYNQTQDSGDWMSACLFLGLGILTKTVPLILIPLLAGGFRKAMPRVKFLGLMLLLGPVTLGMSIIYVLSPANVTKDVLEYHGQSGFFGISGLLHLAGQDQLVALNGQLFDLLLLGVMVACFILFWRRQSIGNSETILLASLMLMSIPVLGPAYAPQYLYWYLPFLVALYAFYKGAFRAVLTVFAVVLVCTYLFEYAILSSDGAYFLNTLISLKVDPHPWVPFAHFVQKCDTQRGQTLLRLPLFVAYLVLLGTGISVLRKKIKETKITAAQ
jgi:hypothetical protein